LFTKIERKTGGRGVQKESFFFNVISITFNSHDFPDILIGWALLRCLRLVPVAKLVKFFLYFDMMGLSRYLQRLIKAILSVYGVIHYFGCIYWALGAWNGSERGWIYESGLVDLPFPDQYLK
jgi:hypothetical protein